MIKSISKDGLYNMGRERSFSGATRERSVSGATTVSDTPSGMRHVRSDISLASLTERIQVPLLGFGTFNDYENHSIIASAVKNAIKCGYRHFNLAKMFDNESEIGAAIRESIAEGVVDREELFISSKLWCDDQAPEDVETALRGTLKRTGLDYVDNFMVHWPTQWLKGSGEAIDGVDIGKNVTTVHVADEEALYATWKSMEALLRKGLTRSLGVSNFDHVVMSNLCKHVAVKPLTLEVEMHPYLAQNSLLEFCKLNDIHVVAHSPLGKAGYTNDGRPNLLEDPVVVAIAEALKKSPAQILLRWGVQRQTSVIPRSTNSKHIKSNADILAWCLSDDEMYLLSTLDRQYRFVQVPWFDFDLYDNRLNQIGDMEAVAHPELLNQPLLKAGEIDDRGVYINTFGREGKRLETEIFMKRGVMTNMKDYYKDILPEACLGSKNYVVTDELVDGILDVDTNFIKALAEVGVNCTKIIIPAEVSDDSGEASVEPYKTTDVLHDCVDTILKKGISKHTCIISVGGGVVNNMCGVLASMLYRGISLVHFTTTTMGMLDAALDFKQAVNHQCGKNLLGCYYAASKVIIDPECVSSLSTRHVQNGIAEALKHAFCQSVEMMNRIVKPVRENGHGTFRDSHYIEMICKDCVEVKVPTLDYYHNSDFNEMCPQYGHSVGHAVESLSWSTKTPLLHGEAVAIGMCVSSEIALMRGLCDQECVDTHYGACHTLGLPVFIPSNVDKEDILKKMVYDKHFLKNPTMGLVAAMGLMACNKEVTLPNGSLSFSFEVGQEELQKAFDINIQKRQTMEAMDSQNTLLF